MSDEDRSHPRTVLRDAHPAAALLHVEAVGLAAVAGGLATSIAEGFPRSGAAVVGFEGVTLAFAMTQLSLPAAAAALAATVTAWFCVGRGSVSARRVHSALRRQPEGSFTPPPTEGPTALARSKATRGVRHSK